MKIINLHNPGSLVFGPACFDQLVEEYLIGKTKRIYILTIEPIFDLIKDRLELLKEKDIRLKINMSLSSEPTIGDFNQVIREADEFRPDCIAGIGGGSVMDLAKLVAAFTGTGESIESFIGSGMVKARTTHLVCVPTTSGTGSEVSPNAILLDGKTGAKKGIISPHLVPDAAFVDPELTLGLSSELTAYTGVDALTHCIEAYTNKFAHPVVDVFALEGIKLIFDNLEKACRNGNDLEARTNVALGSMYGGMCLGPVNTAAVHALAYPLGSVCKLGHGLSNAILLPYVMSYNQGASTQKKYASIAKSIEGNSQDPVELIKNLLHKCGIPSRMRDVGVDESDLVPMAESAFTIKRLLRNNPRKMSLEDIISVYRTAF